MWLYNTFLCRCFVTIPPRSPEYVNLFETISLLGRWSTSGSDRGIAHFFIATRNAIKGVGEKNKEQTNNMLGLIQAQEEELCNIAFPMCICRLTLAWISSEISTKLLGIPNHLDWSSLTALDSLSCRLVSLLSGVDWPLASPFANCLLWVPLSHSLLAFPSYFRWRRDSELRPLFGFAPKQTKRSPAWRTTYIVLQF